MHKKLAYTSTNYVLVLLALIYKSQQRASPNDSTLVRDSCYATRIISYEGIISISDCRFGDSMHIMNTYSKLGYSIYQIY